MEIHDNPSKIISYRESKFFNIRGTGFNCSDSIAIRSMGHVCTRPSHSLIHALIEVKEIEMIIKKKE